MTRNQLEMKTIYTLILLFLTVFIGLKLSAQENIAPKASKLATSFVSTWEKLNAINDGYDPKNSMDKGAGAYGNWNQAANFNKWNWVEYDFASYYLISSSQVYWWTDGGGIQIPYDTYIQYQDIFSGEWKNPENIQGNGVLADQYNATSFSPILTNKIRIYCISSAAQGILEWKVFGVVAENIPTKTTISINKILAKGSSSLITVNAKDANGNAVQGYNFEVEARVSNAIQTVNENYQVKSQSINANTTTLQLLPTDATGKTSFEVVLPATIDPNDGIEIRVKLNGGIATLVNYNYFEPGLVAPILTADATSNNVDHNIEITFTDMPVWRDKISGIKVNGKVLAASDYELQAGILKLIPSAGNELLTKAGAKSIVIEATGYKNATVSQIIAAGAVSLKNSYIDNTVKIYRPSTTKIAVYAFDAFNNPVEGYSFKFDVEVVNNSKATKEVYFVEDAETEESSTGNTLSGTDKGGKTTLTIKIPVKVDINDGILLQLKMNDNVTPIGEKRVYTHREGEREVYVPKEIKAKKEFSWDLTAQSEHFTAFWGGKTGPDPLHPSKGGVAFDPKPILEELEKYYDFYIDSMKFILNPETGNMAKYKSVIVLFNTWESGYADNGAYGASVDETIGGMWMAPQSGFVIAHEFGHACQAMIPIQYPGKGFKNIDDNHNVGMYWEACANYMAFLSSGQTGNMLTPLFMNTSMLQYLSTIDYRQYESVYVPAYIIDKFGIKALGKQWRGADKGDNPFDAMMKGFGMTRDEMRREAGLWAMHNVTWDYSIGNLIRKMMNGSDESAVCRKFTYLEKAKSIDGAYIVPREMAPADYGYNIVPVYPNTGETTISASLKGFENTAGGGGGWSYGFVAVDKKGNPRYGQVALETDAQAAISIEPTDSLYYLVVTGTPVRTNTYPWTPNWSKVYRFPYSVKFENALPAGHNNGSNAAKNTVAGAPHTNGGGWVASTAKVDASAFVGPNAQVLENAKVAGNARIEDYAIVKGSAQIKDNALVRGNAIVGKAAVVSGNALVEKAARVYDGKVMESGVVTGSAVAINCTVYDQAVLKDVSWLNKVTLNGTAIVGGDNNKFETCSEGIYLSLNQSKCNKTLWDSKLTEEANPVVDEYYYPYGDIPQTPDNVQVKAINGKSVVLSWDAALDNGTIVNYIVFQNGKPLKLFASTSDTITGLNPKTSYTFSLRARDNAGNISEQSTEVQVSTPVSINTIKNSKFDFKINPNPANSKFHVELDQDELANMTIYNLVGEIAYCYQFKGQTSVEKDKLGKSGVYFVKVESQNQNKTKKLIID
jgi:carbonic anhydrase/acetyltransferase-like protein (isoleucine patch superfamily)